MSLFIIDSSSNVFIKRRRQFIINNKVFRKKRNRTTVSVMETTDRRERPVKSFRATPEEPKIQRRRRRRRKRPRINSVRRKRKSIHAKQRRHKRSDNKSKSTFPSSSPSSLLETNSPTQIPSNISFYPSVAPSSLLETISPTQMPSITSFSPSFLPTSISETILPSKMPSIMPVWKGTSPTKTSHPSETHEPTNNSLENTSVPTVFPSINSSFLGTIYSTLENTAIPTSAPSTKPTILSTLYSTESLTDMPSNENNDILSSFASTNEPSILSSEFHSNSTTISTTATNTYSNVPTLSSESPTLVSLPDVVFNKRACWTEGHIDHLDSPIKCQNECKNKLKCNSWSYHNSRTNKRCHLCEFMTPRSDEPCEDGLICSTWGTKDIVSTDSSSLTPATLPSESPTLVSLPDVVYNKRACWTEGHIDHLDSPKKCQNECINKTKCTSWSYHNIRNNNRCHLCNSMTPKRNEPCDVGLICSTWGTIDSAFTTSPSFTPTTNV